MLIGGFSGVLTMLIQETGSEVKKKPSDWLQIGRLAVRMTVPLVSRCRALGEAAHDGNLLYLISLGRIVGDYRVRLLLVVEDVFGNVVIMRVSVFCHLWQKI